MRRERILTLFLLGTLSLYAVEWRIQPEVSIPTLVSIQLGPSQWKATDGNPYQFAVQDLQGHRVMSHTAIQIEAGQAVTSVTGGTEGKLTTARILENNRLELTYQVPSPPKKITGVDLNIAQNDFEREMNVWGIDEKGSEELLIEGARLFDYSRHANLRKTQARWNAVGYNTFRIVLTQAEDTRVQPARLHRSHNQGHPECSEETWMQTLQRPLQVKGASFFTETSVLRQDGESIRTLELKQWNTRELPDGDQQVEVVTAFHPIRQLTLSSSTPTYQRHVDLFISNLTSGDSDWQLWKHSQLHQIRYQTTSQSKTTFRFPDISAQRVKLRIRNELQAPLKDVHVTLSGPQWALTFLAEPSQEYRLVTTENVTPSSTDVLQELILQGHPSKDIPLGEVIPVQEVPTPPVWKDFLGSQTFLAFTVLMASAVMGVSLFKAAQQM